MSPLQLRSQYLVCYDIADNRSRAKVADSLLNLGLLHIQKSVFWGFLSVAEINSIIAGADELLESADKLLVTPVNTRNKNTRYLGHHGGTFTDWRDHASI